MIYNLFKLTHGIYYFVNIYYLEKYLSIVTKIVDKIDDPSFLIIV